ncbi:hypothetical protein [Streptomyces sp. SAS_260]|uniref:hypothetical protein n=1 Tax=Streptomyces sp. SAS_260 TaxID=3412751 RepID=UPI00403CF810
MSDAAVVGVMVFTWAKRNGLIFRNPTSRIKVGQYEYAVLQPLVPAQVDRSVAAATTPATRIIRALAAVLGNRRLTIAGRVRPLDDLTLKLLLDWLEHRRCRWPNTANLHLLINNQTATKTNRASNHWISAPCADRTRRWSGSASTGSLKRPSPMGPAPPPRRGVRARRGDRHALRGLRTSSAGTER